MKNVKQKNRQAIYTQKRNPMKTWTDKITETLIDTIKELEAKIFKQTIRILALTDENKELKSTLEDYRSGEKT